ncbi:hypothetical protein GCM10009643_18900 [Microbacterium aurantiacum]
MGTSPADDTIFGSSKTADTAAGACLNCIYEMPLRLDEQNPKQALFFPVRGAFLCHDAHSTPRLIGGSRLSPDSLPASTLGLDPSGNESFEPRVPISAVVLGADGAFRLDLVESFEVTTVGDLIQAIELNQVGNRAWTSVSGELEDLAESWGWSPADLDRLQDDLTQAARETSGAYSASLPQIEHNGALVSIEVTIEPDSNVNLSFSFSPLP